MGDRDFDLIASVEPKLILVVAERWGALMESANVGDRLSSHQAPI